MIWDDKGRRFSGEVRARVTNSREFRSATKTVPVINKVLFETSPTENDLGFQTRIG